MSFWLGYHACALATFAFYFIVRQPAERSQWESRVMIRRLWRDAPITFFMVFWAFFVAMWVFWPAVLVSRVVIDVRKALQLAEPRASR